MSPPPDLDTLLGRPTLELARALLGWRLVRDDGDAGHRVARIVELEAYIGEDDRAAHSRFGRTARNAVMYGPPGRAYVYLVYGMHDCLNIVTEPAGSPAALLVRAAEPLEGAEAMRAAIDARRNERSPGRSRLAPGPARSSTRATVPASRLAAGPGLVCAAFGIDRTLTGQDLFDPAAAIRVEPPPAGEPTPVVVTGPRIGIAYAGEPWTTLPWRFAIASSPSVSRPPIEPGAARPPRPAR